MIQISLLAGSRVRVNLREAQETHNKGCEREEGPGAGAPSTAIVSQSDKTWIKITFLLFYISNSLFC